MSGQWESLAQTDGLCIYLLGSPRVEWATCPLAIPRRQARALLYRLAAHLEPVPREHLCFLFWPDLPESVARRNLSHLLTHLRRALPDSEALLDIDDHVELDPRRAWSDTAAFEKLCVNLTPPPSTPSPFSSKERGKEAEGGRGEALQQAVDLYRGPFLAGFSLPTSPEFEAWATLERYSREHLYLKALAALIEEWAARGEYQAAIACALRYLATDDLAEDVHRRLIELYAAAGDRSAALRQFECCSVILERELGVNPLPQTRAVYQAILKGQPSPPAVRPAWTTLPGLSVPLLGRDRALRILEQAYRQAQAGRGGVALISGEAGLGKSRLMQEFATRLAGRALVLAGAGHSATQTIPYQPIIEALRAALGQGAEEQEGDAPLLPPPSAPIWLSEASRLLPELRDLYPDLPPPSPAEPDEARGHLFEALCQIILGLAASPTPPWKVRENSPLLLCLDDLQWADASTLEWLAYLGRRLGGHRVLVIGAYRGEEAEMVARLRYSLSRYGVLSEVDLEGLDKATVFLLLHHLPPLPSPPPLLSSEEEEGAQGVKSRVALADRLHRTTGGNPFFLLEILRVLLESGWPLDRPIGPVDLPLPDTVRAVVEARLALLGPVARQVLEAGAVLGPCFGFDLVRLTAGRREMETMEGLDELVARQLLVETQPLRYCFHHNLTQRVVEMGLSPVRCQLLHRRAGRALERLAPNEVTALAHHFDTGGEVKKALHYHGLAAQQAEALFAWREAEEHQSRMLILLDRLDPDHRQPDCLAQRGQVLMARAHQRYLQGRLAEWEADLAALAALAEVGDHEELRLQALLQRARYLNLSGRYREAIAVAQEAPPSLPPISPSARSTLCHLLVEVGFAHYLLGQPRQGLAALGSALAIAGEKAEPEIQGPIAHNLGYMYLHMGEYARALACQQEAYACHRAAGDYNGMAWAGLDIGFVHLKLGHLGKAGQYLTESLTLARRIGARPAEAYALTYSGYLELYRGNYAAAADRLRQTLPMHQAMCQEHGTVAAEAGLGLALYHLGRYAEARSRLQDAVERARAVTHRRRLVEALIGLGLVELADDQARVARRCLTEAVELARTSECYEGLVAGLVALARAERESRDHARALIHAGEALRIARQNTLPLWEMWGEVEASLTLLAQGDPAAALEHTERAVTLVPGSPEGWIGTEEIHLAHARVLRALGQADRADNHDRQAAQIIQAKADRIPDLRQRQHYLQSKPGIRQAHQLEAAFG